MRFPGLAAAVVERIAPYIPAEVELHESPEGFMQARLGEERWESYPLDEPEVEEEIDPATYDPPYPAFVVLEAIDFLQEFVRAELGVDWEDGEPWADLEDDEIRFGFSGGASFEPIPLPSLNP